MPTQSMIMIVNTTVPTAMSVTPSSHQAQLITRADGSFRMRNSLRHCHPLPFLLPLAHNAVTKTLPKNRNCLAPTVLDSVATIAIVWKRGAQGIWENVR